MADNPIIDVSITQNPAPFPDSGQEFTDRVRAQVDIILAQFLRALPSNYVSRVSGPFYTLQFQAAVEQLAVFQVTAQEVFKDSDYDFTRPEFLWEMIGQFIFPGATSQSGIPTIDGDKTYRDFLKQMVVLLLRGATADAVGDGVGLLTEAEVLLVERFIGARSLGSAFTIDDQFFYDILIEEGGGTAFPSEPFVLQRNVQIVLQALKPAHVLYDYAHLFRDVFGDLFTDTSSWNMSSYYYDDLRRFHYGTQAITGASGVTLVGRTLFSDPSRDFDSVQVGGILRITSGQNAGSYRILEVVSFPIPTDTTPRAYTTFPSGLSGSAFVTAGVVEDTGQDFGVAVEGEALTFSTGPNMGTYRIGYLLGNDGGPVGLATGPATRIKILPTILRVEPRMSATASGQSYSVDVDRLGTRVPHTIVGEDVAEQFYL